MQGILVSSLVPPEQPRRPRLWVTLVAALFFAGLMVFLNVGRWLVVEDPLQKASAIAVLSGRIPGRALEAARVYKQGYAPRIWLTYSSEPKATLEKLSISF